MHIYTHTKRYIYTFTYVYAFAHIYVQIEKSFAFVLLIKWKVNKKPEKPLKSRIPFGNTTTSEMAIVFPR